MVEFIDLEQSEFYGKLIVPSNFNEIAHSIKGVSLSILNEGNMSGLNNDVNANGNDYKISLLEDYKSFKTNPQNGDDLVNNKKMLIASYDESILRFDCLEGFVALISHAVVLLDNKNKKYIPIIYLTFNFYTQSKLIAEKSEHIKYSDDPEMQCQIDYIEDRYNLLIKAVPKNSILLIDGALIAGDVFTYFISKIKFFHENDIIPVFIVKKSTSNLVTNYYAPIKKQYNSDLHWCFHFLKTGERSNFFHYQDNHNEINQKAFCYLKMYDQTSPQRIEMHYDTYKKYKDSTNQILDIISYLMLVQGDKTNPQTRTIFIAEKYARSAISFFHVKNMLHNIGLIPTINQSRFGD